MPSLMLHCPLMSWPQVSWGRLVAVLVLAVAGLQLLHMVLLNRLEAHNDPPHQKAHKLSVREIQTFYSMMKAAIENSHTVDSGGEYKIVNNFYEGLTFGSRDERGPGVTLVSQCSVDHLHHLVALSSRWQGPLSVAIFTPGNHIVLALQLMSTLLLCVPALQQNISIQLVYPFIQTPVDIPETLDAIDESHCDHLYMTFKNQVSSEHNYALQGIKYPNNLLRNTALRNARTEFIFVVDIDMLPSIGLHASFMAFIDQHSAVLSNGDTHMAYVVPAFEVERGAGIPTDRASLLESWSAKQVRPFYHELCWRCHSQTDYPSWRAHTSAQDGLQVAYEVQWKDPWEPFYIAHFTVPLYDERFKQYGFNRISQACELHVAGFTFAVLNKAFVLHLGFKTPEDFHLTKDIEQEQNRLIFRQFKLQLKTKYPDSSRRCY